MAETKVTLQTIVQDEELKKLNEELAKGQQEVKAMEQVLRQMEKATNKGATATAEQAKEMQRLRQEINMHKQANTALNREINNGIKTMQEGGKAAKSLADNLKEITKVNFGIDIDSLQNMNIGLVGAASAAIAASSALISSGKELSRFSNQFISFSKNANEATVIYNKFNEVYRNTNYDEQRVYDMGKALMAVGISANESADLIMKCADASAHMGKGAEFAEELTKCFERLAVGGELTERQYKALAEAGIDLSDVQEQMRKGGTEAYEALKQKLAEYEGGMANAKQTAEEMEGDIKGNLIEIARQTALLVDDFFGFSDSLKNFYQWVIDTSGKVVDSIKQMRNALRENIASADAYSQAIASYGEEYDRVKEAAEHGDQDAAKRLALMHQQAEIMSQEAKDAEALRIKEEEIAALESKRAQVKSIAGAGGSSSGGGVSKDKSTDEALKAQKKLQDEIAKIAQDTIRIQEQKYGLEQKDVQILNQKAQIGKTGLELAKLQYEQDMAMYEEQIRKTKELTDAKIKAVEDVKAATQKAIDEGVAPDGSSEKIEKLNEQIEALKLLGEQQVKNIKDEADARKAQYEDDSGLTNSDPGSNLSTENINGLSTALNMIKANWKDFTKQIETDSPQLKLAFNAIGAPFAGMCESIINGTKSASEAMKDFVKQMITQALNLLAQWTMIFALVTAFKGPQTGADVANKMVLGLKDGGLVSGPGGPRSDSVPAMLSDGEYVLNASAVDRLGTSYLDSLNAGANPVADAAPANSSSITLNVSAIDANSFGDFLTRGGLDSIKQALTDDDRMFGAAAGVW